MMDNNSLEYWFANLQNERPYLDEATLIKLVESRVTELLDTQPDLLWSYLYRLDAGHFCSSCVGYIDHRSAETAGKNQTSV